MTLKEVKYRANLNMRTESEIETRIVKYGMQVNINMDTVNNYLKGRNHSIFSFEYSRDQVFLHLSRIFACEIELVMRRHCRCDKNV